jgi:hypothetical protein
MDAFMVPRPDAARTERSRSTIERFLELVPDAILGVRADGTIVPREPDSAGG